MEGIQMLDEAVSTEEEGVSGNATLTRERFDTQFDEWQRTNVDDYQIRFASFVHDSPGAEWFVFVGGFSQGKEGYADNLYDVAKSGRNILYTNPLKGIPVVDVSDSMFLDTLRVPPVMAAKANEVRLLLKEKGIEHAHVSGHSQGTAVSAVLSALKPQLARKMILDAPAGLRGGDSSWRITFSTVIGKRELKGQLAKLAKELENGLARHDGETEEEYQARVADVIRRVNQWDVDLGSSELNEGLLWRLTKEVPALAKFSMLPVLERLDRERKREGSDDNRGIYLISSHSDRTFEADKVRVTTQSLVESAGTSLRRVTYPDPDETHKGAMYATPGLYRQLLEQ